MAIRIVNKMYDLDHDGSYCVLVSQLKFGLGPYVTPLFIADDAGAREFMSQGCCQTYLQRVWKGNMGVDTPVWKVSEVFQHLTVVFGRRYQVSNGAVTP